MMGPLVNFRLISVITLKKVKRHMKEEEEEEELILVTIVYSVDIVTDILTAVEQVCY
jgi:hypothetical protein